MVSINSVPGSVSWHKHSVVAQPSLPLCSHPSRGCRHSCSSPILHSHSLASTLGLSRGEWQKHRLRLLPGWRGRGSWEVWRCTHTRAPAHTAPHIRVHPHTQPHTHPLSLHRCRCTSSIFCAPAPTRQGGQCPPSPGTAPAASSPRCPCRRGHRGQTGGRHGVSGRAAAGSEPLPHRRCGCPGTGMGWAGAGQSLPPVTGSRAGLGPAWPLRGILIPSFLARGRERHSPAHRPGMALTKDHGDTGGCHPLLARPKPPELPQPPEPRRAPRPPAAPV